MGTQTGRGATSRLGLYRLCFQRSFYKCSPEQPLKSHPSTHLDWPWLGAAPVPAACAA